MREYATAGAAFAYPLAGVSRYSYRLLICLSDHPLLKYSGSRIPCSASSPPSGHSVSTGVA